MSIFWAVCVCVCQKARTAQAYGSNICFSFSPMPTTLRSETFLCVSRLSLLKRGRNTQKKHETAKTILKKIPFLHSPQILEGKRSLTGQNKKVYKYRCRWCVSPVRGERGRGQVGELRFQAGGQKGKKWTFVEQGRRGQDGRYTLKQK